MHAFAGGLQPLGVVDDADARVVRGGSGEDGARRVGAHPVGDEDLQPVLGVVLRAERAQARLDVALFVHARHDDGDEGELARPDSDGIIHGKVSLSAALPWMPRPQAPSLAPLPLRRLWPRPRREN